MQNKVRSNFYHPKTQISELNQDDVTFQNFLLLVQLKNHNKVKEKQLKIQQYRQLKDKLQNKIKIIPNKFAQGLQQYDQKINQQLTSHRLSMHLPTRRKSQNQLPKIKRTSNVQMLPNLRKQYRSDQLNSIRSFSFRLNPENSSERTKSNKPKILLKRHKTDFINRQRYFEVKAEFIAKKREKNITIHN